MGDNSTGVGDQALFDVVPYQVSPGPAQEKPSPDRRRTELAAVRIAAGLHPLSGTLGRVLPLHPDADRGATAGDGPRLPLRCGTCRYRQVLGYHRRSYPKCVCRETNDDGAAERVTHGAGSDVRAWWPACRDYSPGDPAVSFDAARYIPQVAGGGNV